jgi:polyhydroxyalkanoate synthesis regulator phasin
MKGTWNNTRTEVGKRVGELEKKAKRSFGELEKKALGSVGELEKKAKASVGELEVKAKRSVGQLEKKAKASIDEVPEQLRGAWERVIEALRTGMDVATREDLGKLTARVEELADAVDRLAKERVVKVQEKVTKLRKR